MKYLKKCLIVIDYQNDFVSGSLGFDGAEKFAPKIAQKIKEYRKKGDEIIFTFDTHRENYAETQEGRNLPVPHCIEGTPGHELVAEIEALREDSDKCFYKPTFCSDELYEYLKANTFDEIELVGLVSNICVISNAVLAKTAQPETKVSVDASCTGCFDPRMNEAALDVMAGLQVHITNREA